MNDEEIVNELALNSTFKPKNESLNEDITLFTSNNLLKKIEWNEEGNKNKYDLYIGDNNNYILEVNISGPINHTNLQEEIDFNVEFNLTNKSNNKSSSSSLIKKTVKGWNKKLKEIIDRPDSIFSVHYTKKTKLPSELKKEEVDWQKPNEYKTQDIKFEVYDLSPDDREGTIEFKAKILSNGVEAVKTDVVKISGFWNNKLMELMILNNSIKASEFGENLKQNNKRNSVILNLKAKNGLLGFKGKYPNIYLNDETKESWTIKNYGISPSDDQNATLEVFSLKDLKPGDIITIKISIYSLTINLT